MASDWEKGNNIFSEFKEPHEAVVDEPWQHCRCKTGFGTQICRKTITAVLTGNNIVGVMCEHGLTCEDVIKIREAFDEYTTRE